MDTTKQIPKHLEAQKKEAEHNQLLQRIAHFKKQLMADIIKRRMETDLFPEEKISELFKRAVYTSLWKSSPLSYQANTRDFQKALRAARNMQPGSIHAHTLTITDFQLLCNSIEAVSPEQLGFNEYDYDKVLDECFSLSEIWQELITKINNDSLAEAEQEYAAKCEQDPNIPRLAKTNLAKA